MFLECADKATAALKRNQKHDCLLGPVGDFRLLGGLATHAFLLRHLVAGRRARYFAPFHAAGCMAAFLGQTEVLRAFGARGIRVEDLSWGWREANPLDFAVVGRHRALVKELLAEHPGLARKEEWRQDAVAYCVQYGTIPILRLLLKAGMPPDKCYWSGPENGEWRSPEGTPFFLAVAADRRDMVRELIRLGAFPDPAHTGGTSAVHLASSLLSIAVQHGDFELADWLVERGWLHPSMENLPLDSEALDNLGHFRWLCGKFPERDYKAVVRNGGEVVLANTGEDVLKFAWDGEVPANVREAWSWHFGEADWRPGNPFPENDSMLASILEKHPDELIRLEREQTGRFRGLMKSLGGEWMGSVVSLLRLAVAKGIAVFRDDSERTEFLETANPELVLDLSPHLAELGFPPISELARQRAEERRTRWERAAWAAVPRDVSRATPKELQKRLDSPSFVIDLGLEHDRVFLLEVARRAPPRTFDALVLRGADPYESTWEGDIALSTANARLAMHLMCAYGMLPDKPSYDGHTPLVYAIEAGDIDRVKTLIRGGVRVNAPSWAGDSPLHQAILAGHDAIARLLMRHGAVNRDRAGRVRKVEPWMTGGAQRCDS